MGEHKSAVVENWDTWRLRTMRLEFKRRAKSIEHLAQLLEECKEDYPTPTPLRLSRTIRNIAKMVHSRVDNVGLSRFHLLDRFLDDVASHLRYVERSKTEHTPWSLIQAIEGFLKRQINKEVHFIVRPQWSYAYDIGHNLVDDYKIWIEDKDNKDKLGLGEKAWEAVVNPDKTPDDEEITRFEQPIYCVSFPRVERLNVLMHAAWAHEVGHILARSAVIDFLGRYWNENELKIRQGATSASQPEEETKQTKEPYGPEAVNVDLTRKVIQCWLGEFLSDAVGAYLLGPAYLLTLTEFVLPSDPDFYCESHPPNTYRLVKLTSMLSSQVNEAQKHFETKSSKHNHYLEPYFGRLQSIISHNQEPALIEMCNRRMDVDPSFRYARRVVEKVFPNLLKEVFKTLEQSSSRHAGPGQKGKPHSDPSSTLSYDGLAHAYRIDNRIAIIGELVERIAAGIPPNETGHCLNPITAELPDIFNAAWTAKYYWLATKKGWGTPEDYVQLFKLTLRGIESSHVRKIYVPGQDVKNANTRKN